MKSYPDFTSSSLIEKRREFSDDTFHGFFGSSVLERPREPKTKKKKKPKKEIPPMDTIDVALQKMKLRFEEIEKEHLGGKRGVKTVKWLAGKKCEGLHKTVTTKMANTILNSWVYCRHALQHGHYQLNDMTKKELAESILGKGTKVKVPDRDARIILKELFRFGKSMQLERYMELDREKRKLMGRQVAFAERNVEGVPKIRNLSTREEMVQHGYSQEEISDEMHRRARHEYNRLMKLKSREMPAYLRSEVSGSRRRDAERVIRLQQRKEKRALRKKLEREARLKALGLAVESNDDSSGESDGENTSKDYSENDDDEKDTSSDNDFDSDSGESDDEDESDDENTSKDDSEDEKDNDFHSDSGDSDDDFSDDFEEESRRLGITSDDFSLDEGGVEKEKQKI